MTQRDSCPHGHPYTPENSYLNPQGHRRCRTCRRNAKLALKAQRQACASARRQSRDLARFFDKVQITPTCWIWVGQLNGSGYGKFSINERFVAAHRYAHTIFVGPIPDGYEVDHVKARGCTDKRCVNPAHLEAVTPEENLARSMADPQHRVNMTHCHRGHPFDKDNTRFDERGHRRCRACEHDRSKVYRLARAKKLTSPPVAIRDGVNVADVPPSTLAVTPHLLAGSGESRNEGPAGLPTPSVARAAL